MGGVRKAEGRKGRGEGGKRKTKNNGRARNILL
jgi:hypothetical protein